MNRKGVIGQALTSVPSLIIVFIVMLFFVIISFAIAKNHEISYNLMEDFLGDYVVLGDEVITVRESIELYCKGNSLRSELNLVLREHFMDRYGKSIAFALTSSYGYYDLHMGYGVFDNLPLNDIIPRVSISDFEKEFPKLETNRVSVCKEGTFAIWIRGGS